MKKIIIVIVSFLIQSSICFAQSTIETDTLSNIDTTNFSYFEFFDFSFNQKIYLNEYQNQLKNYKNYQWNIPSNYISIGSHGGPLAINRTYYYVGYLSYSYLLPSEIKTNDSIDWRLRGFNFNFSLHGFYILEKKHLEIFITEGLYAGRLKLIDQDNKRLKNSQFGPFVGLMARLKVSRVTLFVLGQVDYDLTSKNWKKQWFWQEPSIKPEKFKQHGLQISAGINIDLYKKKH